MTQLSQTLDRFDLATKGDNAREDLLDVITNISPTDTPFQSNIGKLTSKNTYREWLTDSLASADSTNALIDGDELAGTAIAAAARLGNYHQIARKVVVVSGRAETVDKAGRKSEIGYQLAKASKELKRDVEATLCGVTLQAAAAGDSSNASKVAPLNSWLKTNVSRGLTGTSPTLSGTTYGYPNAAPQDGTDRALSESTLRSVIRGAWAAGGEPDMIMMGPEAKQRFSEYMFTSNARIATPFQDHGASKRSGLTVVGSVDVFVSDYGVMDVVVNRFQREDDVFVLDSSKWAVSYLRPYKVEELAKTHDSMRKALIVDYTLVSYNEAASGIVADIDETQAMTY